MVVLQVLFAELHNRTAGVPLAALLACGYYENRNRAKRRTRGVMRGNALNVTGVRCGGLMPRKVPRLRSSTVLAGLAQAEGSGHGGSRQTEAERSR